MKYIDLTGTLSKNPILNKTRISKGGLCEPSRLEDRASEYCFECQCLFSATAASQII